MLGCPLFIQRRLQTPCGVIHYGRVPVARTSRAPLDVYAGGTVAIGDGTEPLRDKAGLGQPSMLAAWALARKTSITIFLPKADTKLSKNYQDLYLAGDKKAAEEAIPDDYLAKSSLIGPEGFVKERLYALRESGVTLNVSFVGTDAAQRTAQCEALRNLADSL